MFARVQLIEYKRGYVIQIQKSLVVDCKYGIEESVYAKRIVAKLYLFDILKVDMHLKLMV